jgi:hypothetical protein
MAPSDSRPCPGSCRDHPCDRGRICGAALLARVGDVHLPVHAGCHWQDNLVPNGQSIRIILGTMPTPRFVYWAVECKTAGCGKILLDCIGPHLDFHHPMVPMCEPFDIACAGCQATNRYSQFDLLDVMYSVPCGEFQAAIAFRDAIQRARRRDDMSPEEPLQ